MVSVNAVDVIVEESRVDDGVCVESVIVVCAELTSMVLDKDVLDVPTNVVAGTVLVSRAVDVVSTSLLLVGSLVKAFVTCELMETGSVSATAAVLGATVVVVGSVSGVGA